MFQTSHPVTGIGFHDRTVELQRLEAFVADLRAGANRWLAIIGPRKVGKTSLILELSRRITDVHFIMIDTQEISPPSLELFRTSALRVVDQVLGHELDNSLEVLTAIGTDLDQTLDASSTFTALPANLRTTIRSLARAEMTDDFARLCLDLPERMAEALERHIVVAIDEFQELARLGRTDVLPIIRSTWQRHRRVGYVVSGSGRTLLQEMVTQQHSPFFQHFTLMYVEPFSRRDAIALLTEQPADGHRIPSALAERAVTALGGHPFYLQLLGEALTSRKPPYDDSALKDALQDVLFSRSGRLALYLQLGFDRIVGRSTYLAAVLDALSDDPLRMTDIASRIHATTADTSRYLERVGDAVRKRDDGRYELDDPVLGLWLRWRRPGGTIVPMTIVGDAAERDVAGLLAHMGFDLVYQSRASRGAFDLLATRGASQLGIQVKRTALPLSFSRTAWQRMSADAKRLGWRWIIASVDPAGSVLFLDPAKARRGKTMRLSESASIENVVAWIDS